MRKLRENGGGSISYTDFESIWRGTICLVECIYLYTVMGELYKIVIHILCINQGLEMKNDGCTVKIRIWAYILMQNMSTKSINVPRVKEREQWLKDVFGKKDHNSRLHYM